MTPRRRTARAFSLIEVVLALGLISFVLVSLLGIFVIGIETERDSSAQIRAANLATRLVSERRNEPVDPNPKFLIPPLNDPSLGTAGKTLYFADGEGVVSSVADATMACRITSTLSSDSKLAYLTLRFFWPAATASATARPNYRVATAVRIEP